MDEEDHLRFLAENFLNGSFDRDCDHDTFESSQGREGTGDSNGQDSIISFTSDNVAPTRQVRKYKRRDNLAKRPTDF